MLDFLKNKDAQKILAVGAAEAAIMLVAASAVVMKMRKTQDEASVEE